MDSSPDLVAVSAGIDRRLAEGAWQARQTARLIAHEDGPLPACDAAAEVASFAIALSGKRRAARRGGRLSRLVLHFALAASLALASLAAACAKPDAGPEATAVAVQSYASTSGAEAMITAPPRASPARYTDLVLLPTTAVSPGVALAPSTADVQAPVLVDVSGVGAPDTEGATYTVAGHAIPVGTRDGPAQFIVADAPLQQQDDKPTVDAGALERTAFDPWQKDERVAAAQRAIAGQPTVLDAAYNAQAAVDAGGTHTYLDGVVLRVDADNAAMTVIDRALLESGKPTRPEDAVNVAIQRDQAGLYQPGQVVNLRDVVMTRQDSDVNGTPTTFYIVNAALDGSRVEPTGSSVDLQGLLNQRLQQTDADLAAQAQLFEAGPAGTPAAAATATPAPASNGQTVVERHYYGGPSFLDDWLIWMWLTQPRYYGGPGVTIVNPPASPTRPTGDYYYTPPSSAPKTAPAPTGAAERGAAYTAARNAVSGQASGTGGGTAATAKVAAESTARVSAATAKGTSLASSVSSSSAGKSVSSVAPAASGSSSASSAAARSAGRTSGGGSSSGSSSGGSVSRGGSVGGGSGASSSSSGSRGGGFGGGGSSSSSSS
jgi:hypothetical protein